MIDIKKIEEDIIHTGEHLDLMSKILTSYDIVNEILFKTEAELAKDFETEFANYQYILVLSQFELSLALKSIYYSKSDLEKIHNLKKGLSILYETKIVMDKLNPTLKQIKENYPSLQDEFKKTIIIIKSIKKIILFDSRIEEIRNNVFAHFNPNFTQYYNYFEKIVINNDLKLLIEIKDYLYQIERFIVKVRSIKK